jgi:iron-sulfur cluster repair protein YtfE (RIC family)
VFPTGSKLWNEASLLVPHEVIRNDIIRLWRAVSPENFKPVEPWKVDNWFKYYTEYFYTGVHQHHDLEEKIYVPWIKSKVSYIPEKLSDDHKQLMSLLDKIKNKKKDFEWAFSHKDSVGADLAGTELYELVKDLMDKMFLHLAEEERIFPSILKDSFSEVEHDQITQTILRTMSMREVAKTIPITLKCMEQWATPQQIETFRAQMPPFVRFMNDSLWKKTLETKTLPLLEDIVANKKPKGTLVGRLNVWTARLKQQTLTQPAM